MSKGSLSNQLLDKLVVPKPEFGSCANRDDVNGRTWAGMKPNASGEMIAIVDAAWIDNEGSIKIAVHDVHGNTKEMWFTHVCLK